MAKYRVAQEPKEVYYVKCDNCGKEEGPFPSAPSKDQKSYCWECGRYCPDNEAFATVREYLGAKVVGFRFNGNYEKRVVGILLRKGKRVIEASVLPEDECGSEFVLDFTARRMSPDCYMLAPKKPPAKKPVTGTIRLPRVWKRLLALKDLGKYPRLKGNVEIDSRKPYRDDDRGVSTCLSDGTILAYNLSSGDSNYWVNCLVHRNVPVVDDAAIICEFGWPRSSVDKFRHGDTTYRIKVEWYGKK